MGGRFLEGLVLIYGPYFCEVGSFLVSWSKESSLLSFLSWENHIELPVIFIFLNWLLFNENHLIFLM